MRIQESTIQLSASHEAQHRRSFEMTTVQGFRRTFDRLVGQSADNQAAARQRLQELLQSLVEAILAAIDGRKCEANSACGEDTPAALPVAADERRFDWQRTVTERVSESECTNVCGSGKVLTGDGREIDIQYELNLKRDFKSEMTTGESGSVRLRDPLVLNFGGHSCELEEEWVAFDLDADGGLERIPGLSFCSGFLVFDRNGNGRADDGSELFGALSGDGFADLKAFDSDHNGWIDEADPVWGQLALWSGDRFESLAERGVGALYAAAVDAPFSLKTADNELLGQIRSAGLYLAENGEVGSLQQVDLAVSAGKGREAT